MEIIKSNEQVHKERILRNEFHIVLKDNFEVKKLELKDGLK